MTIDEDPEYRKAVHAWQEERHRADTLARQVNDLVTHIRRLHIAIDTLEIQLAKLEGRDPLGVGELQIPPREGGL